MTIEIADDNHIALCKKIPKSHLLTCEFVTFDDFRGACENGNLGLPNHIHLASELKETI